MKAYYIDSSVLLRKLLNQKNSFVSFDQIELAVSSVLLKTECLRTLDRMRLTRVLDEEDFLLATSEFYKVSTSFEFVRLNSNILSRAAASLPIVLGTLDAIHLMSAQIWREKTKRDLIFVTHDGQLAKAAQALGFECKH